MHHILAMKSSSGEILIADQTDNFCASFRDGKWIADDIFGSEELFENFQHIQDEEESMRILAEARSKFRRI